MINDEHVTVVRVHPSGGYAVVNAGHDRKPRAVLKADESFPTVVAAMRWAVRERPGHQIEVAQECANEELLYRAEVVQFAKMLNGAREWFEMHAHRIGSTAAADLGAILFPERVDEEARWLTPVDNEKQVEG
jgi:hypothetical protein